MTPCWLRLHRWSHWGDCFSAGDGRVLQARYCLRCRCADTRTVADARIKHEWQTPGAHGVYPPPPPPPRPVGVVGAYEARVKELTPELGMPRAMARASMELKDGAPACERKGKPCAEILPEGGA